VPIGKLSGEGQEGSVLCGLFGTTALFDESRIAALYPDHASFVAQINVSTDAAVQKGFLLQPDGELIKQWAASSNIGTP
jgi:hypothetical protein